jgi:hypothetical protein
MPVFKIVSENFLFHHLWNKRIKVHLFGEYFEYFGLSDYLIIGLMD